MQGSYLPKSSHSPGSNGGELAYVTNQDDNIRYYFVRSGSGALLYFIDYRTNNQGDVYTYLRNAHGDIVGLVDAAGEVGRYEYDAWGNATGTYYAGTDETKESKVLEVLNANPFRYAGYYYDTDTGLYYLKARYYDPTTGRFLSKDPLPAGHNAYIYAYGNPITLADPSGQMPVWTMRSLALLNNRGRLTDNVVSWLTVSIGMGGPTLRDFSSFHTLAQIFISSKRLGGQAEFEVVRKNTRIDIVYGRWAYEVKPATQQSRAYAQAKKAHDNGFVLGPELDPILAHIHGDLYMRIIFPERGVAIYDFYSKRTGEGMGSPKAAGIMMRETLLSALKVAPIIVGAKFPQLGPGPGYIPRPIPALGR